MSQKVMEAIGDSCGVTCFLSIEEEEDSHQSSNDSIDEEESDFNNEVL